MFLFVEVSEFASFRKVIDTRDYITHSRSDLSCFPAQCYNYLLRNKPLGRRGQGVSLSSGLYNVTNFSIPFHSIKEFKREGGD